MRRLADDETDFITTYVSVFCPYQFYEAFEEDSPQRICFVWEPAEASEKDPLMEQTRIVAEDLKKSQGLISAVVDKEYKFAVLREELQPLQNLTNAVTMALLLISGTFCMSIMFFAMKERIAEIGIKKAFGASAGNIVAQFVLENVFIALISSCLAVAISMIVCQMSAGFMVRTWHEDYQVYITVSNTTFPILIGLVETMAFSIVPSVFYAAMPITTALKN